MVLQHLSRLYGEKAYKPNIRDVRIWFNVLNEIIFDGEIHKFRYVHIKYVRGQCAACVPHYTDKMHEDDEHLRWCSLELNPRFRNFKTFLAVLAHEMVHSCEFINEEKEMSHGPSFFKWKHRIEEFGIPFSIAFYNKGGQLKTA
jgi:hypothetical protein